VISIYLFILFGLLFFIIAVGAEWVKRFPLTTSVIYLIFGIMMGPYGLKLIEIDPIASAGLIEHVTELAVIISLFSAGLKLKIPINHRYWLFSMNLAFTSMAVTTSLIAFGAWYYLNLSTGTAILLGAILAPTDPVLASDVQVKHPGDNDQLRFSLTSEAGLNDGTAFPFVMLGLSLTKCNFSADLLTRWIFADLLWPVLGGLAIGVITAYLINRFDNLVRAKARDPLILDDFLALSLISLSYGAALLFKTYGFLAVFSAGLTLRQIEVARHSDFPMAGGVLFMNEQFERLAEVGVVILLGSMLSPSFFDSTLIIGAFLLFFIIRPVSVFVLTPFFKTNLIRMLYTSWFGIRGIGSLYYLMYALENGLDGAAAKTLVKITLSIITISIIFHGLSVTPLMNRYKSS
jgi:sodium/hydrogen antiporter